MLFTTVDCQFHGDHICWDDRLCSKHILRIKCTNLWLSNLLYRCVRLYILLILSYTSDTTSLVGCLLEFHDYKFSYVITGLKLSHNEILEIQ